MVRQISELQAVLVICSICVGDQSLKNVMLWPNSAFLPNIMMLGCTNIPIDWMMKMRPSQVCVQWGLLSTMWKLLPVGGSMSNKTLQTKERLFDWVKELLGKLTLFLSVKHWFSQPVYFQPECCVLYPIQHFAIIPVSRGRLDKSIIICSLMA